MTQFKRWLKVGLLFIGMLLGPKMLYVLFDMGQRLRQDPDFVVLALIGAPVVALLIVWPWWAVVSGWSAIPELCLIASGWSFFAGMCILMGMEYELSRWRAVLWLLWSLYFCVAYGRDRFDYENFTKTFE